MYFWLELHRWVQPNFRLNFPQCARRTSTVPPAAVHRPPRSWVSEGSGSAPTPQTSSRTSTETQSVPPTRTAALFPTPSPHSPWRSCRICIWAARKTPRTWISWRSLASSTSWMWPLIFLTCSRTPESSSTSRFPSPITGARISHSFSQKPSALLVSKHNYCCYNLLFIQSQFWLNLPGPFSVLKPNGWHRFLLFA